MKKAAFLLTLALLLTLLVTPTVFATAVATETESNDTSVTANTITDGLIKGSLSSENDVDYYKFDANEDYFTVDFKISDENLSANPQLGWSVTVYDETMDALFSENTENSISTPIFAVSGTIYIKVEANSKYSTNTPINVLYDVAFANTTDSHWESEYNDLSTSANTINANETYHGSLLGAWDTDWFQVNSSDYFSVTFNKNMTIPTEYDVNLGWNVSIYDPSANLLEDFNVETTDTSITLPISGNVYVKIAANSAFTENAPVHVYYDLTVNTVTDSQWEDEYNDSSTTANTIKQGTTYHGNLQSSHDVDYYKVKSTSKAIAVNFTIGLDEVDPDYVQHGWKITVYPANSAISIASYTASSVGSFRSITLPYEKGAYYYIKVEADSTYYPPVGQPYHITVVDASNGMNWEEETGNTGVSSATTLTEGKQIFGNLCDSNDMDYYKCKIISGGTIKINFKRVEADNDADGYSVRVVNAAGTEVFSGTVDDLLSASFSKIKVSKGNYYIIVTRANKYSAPSAEIDYNLSFSLTLTKPSVKKVSPTTNTLKVSWAKRSDVSGYQIQYATNKSFSGAKTIKISNKNTTSTTIKGTSASKAYYVRIRNVVKDGSATRYSAWSSATVAINTPTVKKVTPSKNTLKVSWSKNSSATGYEIQYATNKSFTSAEKIKITKNSTTSTTIKSTSASKVYYVRIRVVVKDGSTYYSPWSSAAVAVCQPTVKKVTPSKNTLKVSWDKNSGATGYEIEYSTSKSFTSAKKVKISKNSTTSVTIKNVSAKKTYYVRIRTVVKGVTTSPWSSAYSVKTK